MPSGLNDNSHFDFSDVKRWLKMAQGSLDSYTIVRPGPFICAEYSGGGYPRWLAKFCPGGNGRLLVEKRGPSPHQLVATLV